MTKTRFWPVLFLSVFSACTKYDNLKENTLEPSLQVLQNKTVLAAQKNTAGLRPVCYRADYITDARSNTAGKTYYFFNTGNKQLDVAFVPRDPYRGGRNNITYAIDDDITQDNGLTNLEVAAAIDRAMATWEGQQCSKLTFDKIPYVGNLGSMSNAYGFGGNTEMVADIIHTGFLPAAFFDSAVAGGSSSVLAVTFSFIWLLDGQVMDMDHNGKADLAFSEIYYNDAFDWRTNSGSGYDIETIALHETGHGLGQDHFGKAFINHSNGKLHIAPKAVMNASYMGEQRTLLGTDKGGHCSLWANWPAN